MSLLSVAHKTFLERPFLEFVKQKHPDPLSAGVQDWLIHERKAAE